MAARRKSRERALQLLFELDLTPQSIEEALAGYYGSLHSELSPLPPRPDPFAEALVRGVIEHRAAIDARIARHAQNWRLERMPAVDRNVMRLAVYEMTELGTPAPVAINEALELVRRYSGEEAVAFVNGVLDAVRRELGLPEAARPAPARARPSKRAG